MKENSYDVTFVLPGPSIRYPPGGYDIVYRLAQGLNNQHIKTAIIFQKNPSIYITNFIRDENYGYIRVLKSRVLKGIFDMIFNGKRIKTFYKLRLPKLLGVYYDYSILDNVDCFYWNRIADVKIKTNIIIATAWETAYFVNEFIKKNNSKPFYLIQHSEDEPSYSGKNSINAERTYHFPFKKIVINKVVFKRFENDHPLFFHVGINTNFFKIINGINQRENVILFPLRKNESKGAKYAIECAKKLLNEQNNQELRIVMFGDFKPNEIPKELKNKIEYHHRPKNSELLLLYNKASIFVLPSLVEGMSLPPLEAMACGCAVVVTDNGGTNEYIVNNVNGLVCPIRDSDCLYDKVVSLLNDKDKREQLAKNGLSTAKEYSYDKMISKFTELIKQYL
jgi:glycosyltransferase involved in cell wall biosynthesis